MPGGRPPYYKTPEELQAAIDKYFDNTTTPNITSLVYHLGFYDYRGFSNYAQKEEFLPIVKGAKLRIRAYLHERLMSEDNKTLGNLAFDLKCNHGWVDKHQVDVNASVGLNWGDIAKEIDGADEE
jgi:hypothetical protein